MKFCIFVPWLYISPMNRLFFTSSFINSIAKRFVEAILMTFMMCRRVATIDCNIIIVKRKEKGGNSSTSLRTSHF